jgi:hypothetical protein
VWCAFATVGGGNIIEEKKFLSFFHETGTKRLTRFWKRGILFKVKSKNVSF